MNSASATFASQRAVNLMLKDRLDDRIDKCTDQDRQLISDISSLDNFSKVIQEFGSQDAPACARGRRLVGGAYVTEPLQHT